MENYKVCILAGGIGSRMESFTKYFNKAMLPLQGKPVINHIIEKIPENIETVIALGHLKEGLRTLGVEYTEYTPAETSASTLKSLLEKFKTILRLRASAVCETGSPAPLGVG